MLWSKLTSLLCALRQVLGTSLSSGPLLIMPGGLGGGRGLTIQTEGEEATPVPVPSSEDGRSPASRQGGGTPKRSWLNSGAAQSPASTTAAPGAAPTSGMPRSWLQSPRKWAGRTPTHAQPGATTPNSMKLAAYYSTLQKPNSDHLFGKDEEEANAGGDKPKATTPVSLANLMHQTDASGKSVHTAQPLPPTQASNQLPQGGLQGQQGQQQYQHGQRGPNGGLWNRFVGCFAQPGQELAAAGGESGSTSGNYSANQIQPPTTAGGSTDHAKAEAKPKPRPASVRRRAGLLGEIHPDDAGKKCLVLDLDETLVHSSFQYVDGADFVIPVKIEDTVHKVYVLKRPGVDEFMLRMAEIYEIVIFTASLSLYADPLLDQLDKQGTIRHRLFRESCTYYQGNYVKDLEKIDRDISQIIIVDNSPLSFLFQEANAIGCTSYIDDPADRELDVIAAFLDDVKDAEDVRHHCKYWRDWGKKAGTHGARGGNRIPGG